MIDSENASKKVHQGRNIKRFREMMGIKQEFLAYELGETWTQKKVSLLEQKEIVETSILEQVSKILKIPVEAFEHFNEEQAINIISNTFQEGSFVNTGKTPTFNINPVEKWLGALDENKKLYERMLQQQQEMIDKLERLLKDK